RFSIASSSARSSTETIAATPWSCRSNKKRSPSLTFLSARANPLRTSLVVILIMATPLSSIPWQPSPDGPVLVRAFCQAVEASRGLAVPGHRDRRQVRAELLRGGRAAEHDVGPGAGQDGGQGQAVEGRTQAGRLTFEHPPRGGEGLVRVPRRQTPVGQCLLDDDSHAQGPRL